MVKNKGGSLHPQRDQGSHYSKGVSRTSGISRIRSLLQTPPLARPRPAESECSLLQMPRCSLEAEETCFRAGVLQAEGAPWVKQIQDKSQDTYSFAASETTQVLASALNRGNCGQLMGGRQPWVTP